MLGWVGADLRKGLASRVWPVARSAGRPRGLELAPKARTRAHQPHFCPIRNMRMLVALLCAALVLAPSLQASQAGDQPEHLLAALAAVSRSAGSLAVARKSGREAPAPVPPAEGPTPAGAVPAPPPPATRTALIVVDTQPCFMDGGSLAVPGGAEVVPVINALLENATWVSALERAHAGDESPPPAGPSLDENSLPPSMP